MVSQIQNEFTLWSYFLEDLAANTPPDISLSFLKLNKEDGMIKLRGRAASREGLLLLKQNLENSNNFSNIDFPIKNILQQKNIDFEINAKINL
jgi:Tfp pilus assembly protein PilN